MEFNEPWNYACSTVGLTCREGNYGALEYLLSSGEAVDIQDNRGWRPIHEAAANNRVRCLKLLLEQKKINVNWKSFEGETPLMLAARHGHEEIVQLLMLKGADPNARNNEDESPLMVATNLHKLNCIQNLLDGGADVNQQSFDGSTALHFAIVGNCSDTSIVEALVIRGAKLDAQDCCGITPVFQAAQVGFLAALKVLLKQAKETGRLQSVVDMGAEDGATPVIIATQNGFDECVDFLLQNGADCNKLTADHVSALHLAIQFGHINCANLLLDKMDKTSWQPYTDDAFESAIGSPLHAAIFWKRSDILQRILSSGINPNAVFAYLEPYLPPEACFFRANQLDPNVVYKRLPRLMPPLGVAAFTGCIEDITALLEAGAQINPKLDDVMCPLLVAIFLGHVAAVEFLLNNGADPNCSGRHARRFYSRMLILPVLKAKMVRLLLKHGADLRSDLGHPCVQGHLGDCHRTEVPVTHFQEKHHRIVAVLQEFFSPGALEDYISEASNSVPNRSAEEEQCWKKVFETSRNPPALIQLCRMRVRECLMDNGSNVFPFSKRLEKLPRLPSFIVGYLAYA